MKITKAKAEELNTKIPKKLILQLNKMKEKMQSLLQI